jgi:hypothetical protein
MHNKKLIASIETGDIIAIRGEEGFLTPFTKFFTRSPYTHVGLAVWIAGELWMAEINGGKNHAIPVAQLDAECFDVFARPDGISAERAEIAILEALRTKTNYAFIGLFVIGFLNYLRINIFVHWRKVLVCSGWVVSVLESMGWPEHTRILSPAELCAQLRFRFSCVPQ